MAWCGQVLHSLFPCSQQIGIFQAVLVELIVMTVNSLLQR